MNPPIVISTAFAPGLWGAKCRESVAAQRPKPRHIYIDDAAHIYNPPNFGHPFKGFGTCSQNLHHWINRIPDPATVVIWLDGDDWFPHENVVSYVQDLYRDPALWLTYGQFVFSNDWPGWASPYPPEVHAANSYRQDIWRATHLKTFRAGLFQQIKAEDLKDDEGHWLTEAVDLAVMYPLLEMAGPRHSEFVDEVLCVYNAENASSANNIPAKRDAQLKAAVQIRARKPYDRLP